MRIKINDKIYRLKEIESGVDSLMELVEEPRYKDGDFVYEDGRIMIVKSYPNIYHANVWPIFPDAIIYNEAYGLDFSEPTFRYATAEEKQELIELLRKDGKRWNEEKKCIEDIPKPKFKIGDKVRIKEGISSETHRLISPGFTTSMDDLIGKELTVDGCAVGEVYIEESGYKFNEDWLEPYTDELKEGDLALFWDYDPYNNTVRFYRENKGEGVRFPHVDSSGDVWRNAVKFEGKEQFEKLIKGKL